MQKQKNTSYYIATLTIGTESNRGTERESNQGQSDNHMSDHQLYYIIYDDLWLKEQQIIYNDNAYVGGRFEIASLTKLRPEIGSETLGDRQLGSGGYAGGEEFRATTHQRCVIDIVK